MSNIELVLTDIDGTLVPIHTHDISPVVSEAMRKVQDMGTAVTAATGRPYELAQPLFEELGFRGYGIFDAGASIRDVHTGEVVWQNWLDTERLKNIAEIILPHCAVIDFFPTYKEITPDQTGLKDIVEAAPYVFAFVKETEFPAVHASLKTLPNLTINVGPGREDVPGLVDVQITDIEANKFHAVNELRKLVHSTKDHTLAIGDSDNDIPLFENAGLKIAMGNAVPRLKALADYVVGSVAQDGFAEAMERFVLS